MKKDEKYWKDKLTPEQYEVLRKKGTERAYTGKLLNNKETGTYQCGACSADLFSSDTKFDSGSGWPSFTDVMNSEAVRLESDGSLGMQRTEVICSACDSHLGHVFDDGPGESGKRYCINSASLGFEKVD